ncbi:PH domain-containing protein [Oceanobacillus kimchii]|uniref:PH domain-containing protein n=1 Tax=Oceanobacillus kimchii TaxID=746691 RepID=UPI00295EF8A9|nr:PH domain-containing protein [Oceanobacillus kimchii]
MFKSKKDIWMGIIIWLMIILFLKFLYDSIVAFSIIGIVISIILTIFVGLIWFYTRYSINNDVLVIRYGIIKMSVNIQDITTISKTTNPFVSPALSIYRLEISYSKFKTVQISPKNEELFMEQLKMINPEITTK